MSTEKKIPLDHALRAPDSGYREHPGNVVELAGSMFMRLMTTLKTKDLVVETARVHGLPDTTPIGDVVRLLATDCIDFALCFSEAANHYYQNGRPVETAEEAE